MTSPRESVTKYQPRSGSRSCTRLALWKILARQSQGNGAAVLAREPARLLVNQDDNEQQHAGAITAQQQRKFSYTFHGPRIG